MDGLYGLRIDQLRWARRDCCFELDENFDCRDFAFGATEPVLDGRFAFVKVRCAIRHYDAHVEMGRAAQFFGGQGHCPDATTCDVSVERAF